MNRRDFLFATGAMGIAAGAHAATEARYRPEAGDYGAPKCLVPAPDDRRHAHLGWPKIVRAGDGTLILACCAGAVHTRGGCPAICRSTDGGETFSAPRVLMELGEGRPWTHCGNVALGLAADGAIVLLAMAMDAGRKHNTIFGWRSRDAGRTWEPSDVSLLAGKVGSVYGHVFDVPGRGLAVFGHFREGATLAEQGIWLSLSGDHGASWREPAVVSRGALVEPAFCFAAGRYVGLVRRQAGPGYLQIVSRDLGTTWEERVAPVGFSAGMPSPFLAETGRDTGKLWALQTVRRSSDRRDQDGTISLWSADARTLDWRREGLVARAPVASDFGYPWMAPLGGGEWLLVFYCGEKDGANSIWGMKMTLT